MVTNLRDSQIMIGALADSTGVNVETIRYYERIKLLPRPPRSDGGHRLYAGEHVQCLIFIRRGRELGFSLDDIRALLALMNEKDPACESAKRIALRHLADVHGKIASLRRLERALKTMTEACMPGRQASCPIIESLSANVVSRLQ